VANKRNPAAAAGGDAPGGHASDNGCFPQKIKVLG